ncbi:MAG TPA: FAD-dependent oxidoreductase [Nitrospira sp.]|nr:FAD-dependent oxidoreductase [Nitrospira sp.]
MASLEILVTQDGRQSVMVLGAGPAGLTAAYRLALGGLRVTVLTPSARIGEHVRRESDPPASILGCHEATWALLHALGIRPDQPAFAEAQLEFLLPSGRVVRYPKTRFPTPIQQLLTIGRFSGLRAGERWKLLSWLEQLWEGSVELPADLEQRTAESWLGSLSHSPSSRQTIWAPLARWLTGNDLQHLSADAFVTALKPFFLSHAANSRIWVPRQTWDRAFVQPVTDALAKAQATVCAGTRAVRFEYHDDRITGLRVKDGTSLQADWYLAALPPRELTGLLPERWLSRYAYFQQIVDLETFSTTVLQVRTGETMTSPRHILMGAGPFNWIACKPSQFDRGLVATVTMRQDQAVTEPIQRVSALLRSLNLLQPDRHITGFRQEDRAPAWLALPPGTKVRRPLQRSPIRNLLLAGAWTDTGWPANLESAIVSGERCAAIILQHGGLPH